MFRKNRIEKIPCYTLDKLRDLYGEPEFQELVKRGTRIQVSIPRASSHEGRIIYDRDVRGYLLEVNSNVSFDLGISEY